MRKKKTDTEIKVGIPESVEISLVPANEFKIFELYSWLLITFFPFAAGYWTSYCTASEKSLSLLFSAIIFSCLTIFFLFLTIRQRKKLSDKEIIKKMFLNKFK